MDRFAAAIGHLRAQEEPLFEHRLKGSDRAVRTYFEETGRYAPVLGRALHALLDGRPFVLPPDAAPSKGKAPGRRVPKQVDAPIITDIADDRLVMVPGRRIPKTAPIAGASEYLAVQFMEIAAGIEGNADRRDVEFFRWAADLLGDWSIRKVIAFGLHLNLLERCLGRIRQEQADPVVDQAEEAIRAARDFIENFKEWRAYVERAVMGHVEDGRGDEIIAVAKDATEILAQDPDSVDRQVPVQLGEIADIASRSENKQTAAVGIMSLLRSLRNLAITGVQYSKKWLVIGYDKLIKNGRAMKLLKTLCLFVARAIRLAPLHPELAFLVGWVPDLRPQCELLGIKEPPAQS